MPRISRRELLGGAAAVLPVAMAGAPARVIGANDRINTAIIGVGNLGLRHLRDRLLPQQREKKSIQMVAACDIYEKAKQRAHDLIGLDKRDIHHDYREMLTRSDIDAVVIVTPEHLHHEMAIAALAAGKDVYLEKPMTKTVEEARDVAAMVKKSGRVMQVGSQYVSDPRYHLAREVIEKGWIGPVFAIQASWAASMLYGLWQYHIEPEATAKTVDWNRFLGPAPQRPFSAERYFRWRKYWDYSGGIGPDLFFHELSPMMLAVGPQFPVRVTGVGGLRFSREREVPDVYLTTAEYENFQVDLSANSANSQMGSAHKRAIFGREGTITFAGKGIDVKPEANFRSKFEKATGQRALHLEREPTDAMVVRMRHFENFLDSVRSRKQPVFDADFGYRVTTAIQLGVQSYRESRMMIFDAKTERVVNHAPARSGYEGTGQEYVEPSGSLPDGRVA